MTEDRGYTVPELLTVLALTSVVVLAAAQLVGEAVQLADGTGRAMRSPTITLAMAAMRRDVQDAAAAVMPVAPGWSEDTLELIFWDGRRVRLSLEHDAIVREGVDRLGKPTGRRVLVRGVTSWWWRTPNPWTVDLRMNAMVHSDPGTARRVTAHRRSETRRFVMRGSPGGRVW
jgi:prepilin-type N-terminal cleavage/methylation domain-containing protein